MNTIDYEAVLNDLEGKKAQLDVAISTIRHLTGRTNVDNPFTKTIPITKTIPKMTQDVTTFGFGRNKGVPTNEMKVEDLKYYLNFLTIKLRDGKSRYPDSDKEKIAILENELNKRG
jgi:hypothetical protein